MSDTQKDHKLVVSIINYRTPELTIDCARSVLEAANAVDLRVVIVDNNSGDGSLDKLQDWIAAANASDRVSLVAAPVNGGFSAGHNIGIAHLKAAYYLLLNSDALLRPGFFEAILEAADANTAAGLVAPKITYDDGEQQVSCFRFHSPLSEFLRAAQTGPVTRLFKSSQVALSMPPTPGWNGWASFACILIRGDMINQIGPMDEGYFLYFEDCEYALRANRAGWGIVYAPRAEAIHLRGGSGPVKSLAAAKKRLPRYFYVSRSRFLYQAHGRAGLLAANLLWHLGRGIAQARRFVGASVPQVAERESTDIWTHFLTPLAPYRPEDN